MDEKSGMLDSSATLSRLADSLTPIKPRDLILFTKQFKTLIHAGVPMMDVFTTMEVQTENKRLQKTVAQIREDVRGGGQPVYGLYKT